MITNITISNIKGYGITDNSIDVNIDPSRVNILVAPNGFGKSSMAMAFKSLKKTKLEVEVDALHNQDETLQPSVSICLDGNTYIANSNKNDISKEITPYVINCKLDVKATSQNIHGRYSISKGSLIIGDVEICSIPAKQPKFYKYSELTHCFGAKDMVLTNIEPLFGDNMFVGLIQDYAQFFEKFKAQKRQALVDEVVAKIKQEKGTISEIRKSIADNVFSNLEAESNYMSLDELLSYGDRSSHIDKFDLFYQLFYLYKYKKDELMKASRRAVYNGFKLRFDENLHLLDTTLKGIHSSENKSTNKLMVTFPEAKRISNGQRDLLTFVSQLTEFKTNLKEGKKYLLIIDEVFDYLDDANMIAAQYYLSSILKDNSDIYVVLLTHLNPVYFRSYVFNKKLQNPQYLLNVQAKSSDAMKAFITFREGLNRTDESQDTLYGNLSRYFFHYESSTTDLSAGISVKPNLRTNWFKGINLKTYVLGELNKYLGDDTTAKTYDPYAVCLGIRYRVEKIAYDLLGTVEQKETFVSTKKTDKKLEYAETQGVVVPNACFFLSLIHNDADHLKDPNAEKPCVYKLDHPILKNVVRILFKYNGSPIVINCIH